MEVKRRRGQAQEDRGGEAPAPSALPDGKATKQQPAAKGDSKATLVLAAPGLFACLLLAIILGSFWEEETEVYDIGKQHLSNGTFTVGPRGPFPRKCVWRELHITEEPEPTLTSDDKMVSTMYNHTVSVEYLHTDGTWATSVPAGCAVTDARVPRRKWRWPTAEGPRSDVDCNKLYCSYQNLWYHNGKWYVLVDGPIPGGSFALTKHVIIDSLHVISPKAWLSTVDWVVVPGESVVLDFPFLGHPTAIGHWPELMAPLYSILRNRTSHFGRPFKRTPDHMVLLHLKAQHLMEWVRGLIATTLGVGPGSSLPPIILENQDTNLLEGAHTDLWICFQRAIIAKDHISDGGTRTFASTDHARAFRDAMYALHNLKPTPSVKADLTPADPKKIPRKITFIRKTANRRVVNEEELIEALSKFGEVQVVEFDSTTSMRDQLKVMAETGLLVSSHSSQLANAQFLQPGSAVLELIQRNWLEPFDVSFRVQTDAMGDIHHFAWRCQDAACTRYIDEHFGDLYSGFTSMECRVSMGCMDRHTNVDITVDVKEVSALVGRQLQRLWSDNPPSVKKARIPWPKAW
mmetsp:Transcript_33697/g.95336  ORF Transcript_33697/g.95336 Transcript_33697/m.95336 type:complete len:574 (+) Transcript_33697:210-1931(+)